MSFSSGTMRHVTDLAEAFAVIPAGSTIVLQSACAEPLLLSRQLADGAEAVAGSRVFALMPMGDSPYAEEGPAQHLSITAFFPGKGLREAINGGRARVRRCALSEIPKFFSSGDIKADLLLLQLSPPAEDGSMSLGISVDYMRSVLQQDPVVVAEINPSMPRTCGDTLVHADEVDFVLEAKSAPQAVAPATPDDADHRIAEHVAGLIPSGAVLQCGIGALPDLVLGKLTHLRNLGVHSGIITDALVPLIEQGVVTNGSKKAFRGRSITTMAAGTQAFYDYLDRNEAVEFHPCSLTHSFDVLACIDGLCAINSVLQIDLRGNANAEQAGGRIISAPGGLPDFARGASAAPGGVSILALRATARNGRSSIVPVLAPGVPVTVGAGHIDYVVTEYGVARLRGKGADQVARELISVAHPDFRKDLRRACGSTHTPIL